MGLKNSPVSAAHLDLALIASAKDFFPLRIKKMSWLVIPIMFVDLPFENAASPSFEKPL